MKTVRAVLRFSYDPPAAIHWEQEKGAIGAIRTLKEELEHLRTQLEREERRWERVTAAITSVLEGA